MILINTLEKELIMRNIMIELEGIEARLISIQKTEIHTMVIQEDLEIILVELNQKLKDIDLDHPNQEDK
jgi:hypothetical protein